MEFSISRANIPLLGSQRACLAGIHLPAKKDSSHKPQAPTAQSASRVVQKNLPAKAGDTRDAGSIPVSERSPGA